MATGDQAREPRSVLQEASRHWYWMPAVVLALGVLSLALLFGVQWILDRLLVRDIARVQVLGEVQRDVSISHLWLEEFVAGDPNPQVEDRESEIDGRVESSLAWSEALLQGGVRNALYDLHPLEEPRLRQLARDLRSQILDFRALSDERQAGYLRGELALVETGSALDQRYDRVFGRLLDTAQELDAEIRGRLGANRRRSQFLFRTIFAAWVGIVALAVTGLWTREKRRKEAEEALRRSEARLLQSQKMEAVGRLAGGMAHDVNNYLAAITAQCELVKRKVAADGAVAAKMDAIIASSFRVSALIKRLLAFSRQQPVQPEVVNLDSVVAELGAMMERLIGEDVRFEHRSTGDLWNVEIDPSQLEQIIVNLLVNARDAMPTGGVVTLETSNFVVDPGDDEPPLGAGEYVSLSISDTGTGIDPEILDKIFDPFFTTKGRSGSSGLGLATVYGIVEQNGGAIQVRSRPGEGTTIKIYLPRTEKEATRASATAGAGSPAPLGTGEHILLVEDNEDLRASTKGMLRALDYRVTACSDGEQGLKVFEASPSLYDLMITDVVMPGMGGGELADRIRWLRPELPILFVSGYTDNVILRHGVLEGEADLLEKPFQADQLARRVREMLDRQPDTEAAAG